MDPQVASHVYARLEQAALVLDPFPHFYATDVFPDSYYAELLRSLPADSEYKQFPPPYEERHVIELNHDSVRGLKGPERPFWIDFEGWLHSQELLDRMAAKFGDHLKMPYEYRKRRLGRLETGPVRVVPRSLLSRDYANFAMAPHSDTEHKFIVGAFYLSKDRGLKEFGTSIYKPKKAGLTDWNSTRYDREQFDLVKTFDNLPNSLFVFMKTDNSFHGVEHKPYPNVGRDVLFWTPHVGGKKGSGRELSLPRSLFVPKRSLLDLLGLRRPEKTAA